MARLYKDRVAETTAAPGVNAFALAGNLPGYQAFAGVAAVGDTFDYTAFAIDANGVPNGAWETGTGTFAAGNTIQRDVQESSNGNAIVNFGNGTTVVVAMSENAASIAALAAGGGGGGGGSDLLGYSYSNAGVQVDSNTSSAGAPIPNASAMFNAKTAGDVQVSFSMLFMRQYPTLRILPYLDGVAFPLPDNAANPYGLSQGENNIYVVNFTWIIPVAQGQHTISMNYADAQNIRGASLYQRSLTVRALTVAA